MAGAVAWADCAFEKPSANVDPCAAASICTGNAVNISGGVARCDDAHTAPPRIKKGCTGNDSNRTNCNGQNMNCYQNLHCEAYKFTVSPEVWKCRDFGSGFGNWTPATEKISEDCPAE